jgi:hypothetical protein
MKTQLDFLKEAVSMAEQNPTLKIHFASADEHCEDKSWTCQHITKVEKTWYYTNEDGEIFHSVNEILDYYKGKPTAQPTTANRPSAPCQHVWKICGAGFIYRTLICTKCDEMRIDL